MKELSIEEKAKRYDDAIKRAKRVHNSAKSDKENGVKDKITDYTIQLTKTIFPELAESEDEGVWLKKFIQEEIDCLSIDIRDCDDRIKLKNLRRSLAWLEKQGENSVCKVKIGETYKCIASPRYTCFRMGDIYPVEDNFVAELINTCSGCFVLLEKQGKQKSVAKYKIGDTIYYNSFGKLVSFVIANIVEDGTDNPMYEDKDGNSVFQNDIVEPKFKVGDLITNGILVGEIDEIHELGYHAYFGDHYADVPDIENWHKWTIADAKDGDVLAVEPIEENYQYPFVAIFKERGLDFFNSYCFIGFNGKFYKGENGHSTEKVHPATKEQRDQLEKAMADAGYTFDFNKKELKKIEQNTSDEIGNYDHGKVLDTLMSENKTPDSWSEEDEQHIDSLLKRLEGLCRNEFERTRFAINEDEDWLKFLKERYTWKPSDEQMKGIECTIKTLKYQLNAGDNRLNSLYEDLKKLREK